MDNQRPIKPSDRLFEDNRSLLSSIGYRMLGSISDAEDAVQDTYLRWARHWRLKKVTDVKSAPAYLTSIMTRLCLDRLRHRKVAKLNYIGPWLPEPVPTESLLHPDMAGDALLGAAKNESLEHQVDQFQSVQMALLIMLEALTPQQRAVFVLCEVFDYRHQEAAGLLGLSVSNSRQLLRRAKQQIAQGRESSGTPADASHGLLFEQLFEQFYEALAQGNNEQIEAMLCDDVVAYSDGGGRVSAAIIPLRGVDRVMTVFGHVLKQRDDSVEWRWRSVNQQLGLIMYESNLVTSVTTFDIKEGKIFRIYVSRNPEKLQAFN